MTHTPSQSNAAGPTVLIVEDDERFRERLARAFEDRGWQTFIAADPETASKVAVEQLADLAVVDLRLGTESGIEAVRVIHEADSETVILLLTGYGSIATAVAVMRAGAADYLTKPADVDQLLAAYERVKAGATGPAPQVAVASLDQVEWEHIQRVMADCDGNISRAARLLGVHRRSLQRKLGKRPLPNL
jgi:two-component system response regulator RegA